MTGIVSLGGLCSPALWMSRFVLPHGGPQPLLFRSLFSCLHRFYETCNGTLSKPLHVTCVVISGSLWVPTYQDFPWSLYNSGAAHYDGRPPWWSPLLSSPQSSPVLSLSMSAATCRHLHNTSPLQLSNPGRPLSLPPGTWQPSVRGKEIDRTQGIPPLLVSSSVT